MQRFFWERHTDRDEHGFYRIVHLVFDRRRGGPSNNDVSDRALARCDDPADADLIVNALNAIDRDG